MFSFLLRFYFCSPRISFLSFLSIFINFHNLYFDLLFSFFLLNFILFSSFFFLFLKSSQTACCYSFALILLFSHFNLLFLDFFYIFRLPVCSCPLSLSVCVCVWVRVGVCGCLRVSSLTSSFYLVLLSVKPFLLQHLTLSNTVLLLRALLSLPLNIFLTLRKFLSIGLK